MKLKNNFFGKFLGKLTFERYFNVYIILFFDICMSLVGTMLTFLSTDIACRRIYGFRLSQSCPDTILTWFMSGLAGFVSLTLLLKTYRYSVRYTTLRDMAKSAFSVLCKQVFSIFFVLVFSFPTYFENNALPVLLVWCMLDFVFTLSLLTVVRVCMVVCYDFLKRTCNIINHKHDTRKRILVYGADGIAISAVDSLANSEDYTVMGYIVPFSDSRVKNKILHGRRVYIFRNLADVTKLKNDIGIQVVYFPTEIKGDLQCSKLIEYLTKNHMTALVTSGLENVAIGSLPQMRQINIEDLLEREEIIISRTEIRGFFKGKTVMVTGAAGSIGSELCRQLVISGVGRLVLFDNAETPMHNLRLNLDKEFPLLEYVPVIGDVRQIKRLDFAFRTYSPEIVFHAAAYKHVPLMEENPCEAVMVNVLGTRNVADKCVEYGVSKMVMVSTDKAVNPTNIMGCSKRLAEIYVQSLGKAIEHGTVKGLTKFVTTRFGNVLGSNGSVIPHFKEQIANGGPVTVTHPEITRFFMTIPEACSLVMEAAIMPTDNKICVFDMGKPIRIVHLAERMIQLAGFTPGKDIFISFTGLRPGEKLYEEVLANSENTVPTTHKRIMIACVREYDYQQVSSYIKQLEQYAENVDVPGMVVLMKSIVTEFKSNNSEFCRFDVTAKN